METDAHKHYAMQESIRVFKRTVTIILCCNKEYILYSRTRKYAFISNWVLNLCVLKHIVPNYSKNAIKMLNKT